MSIKNRSLSLLGIFLGIVSCQTTSITENQTVSQKVEMTFVAEPASALTKTTVTSDGSIQWSPFDSIRVFQGTLASGKFISISSENCSKATFKGYMEYVTGSIENEESNQFFWGVYPYSESTVCDGSCVCVEIPAEQVAVAGSFATGAFPSVAKSTSTALAFYNVCGGIRFSVETTGITSVTFKGNNDEVLAGSVTVIKDIPGVPEIKSVSNSSTEITLVAPNADGFTPGEWYYISTIPARLTDGYSLTLHKSGLCLEKSSDSAVEIKRAAFGSLADVDNGLQWKLRLPVADNEIWYESTDGNLLEPSSKDGGYFNAQIVSNEIINGYGRIVFSEPVTHIYDGNGSLFLPAPIGAFCDKPLKAIYLPETIKEIGSNAFMHCTGLSRINSYVENEFRLPDSVERIGYCAFSNYFWMQWPSISAKNLFLGSKLKTIEQQAFLRTPLANITITAMSAPAIISQTFEGSQNNGTLSVPYGATGYEEWMRTGGCYLGDYNWTCEIDCSNMNLSAKGTANCYIVDTYGRCSFDATKKGNSEDSVGDIASAEVLWESFGNDVQPEVGDIVKDVAVVNGIVSFTASGKDGNAVIAVKDAAGDILWSWHIWICEGFNPTATAQEYYNNAGIMMDRNLGATTVVKGDTKTNGLLYQWGRKDPFLSAISNGNPVKSSVSWPTPVQASSVRNNDTSLEYAISNPMTFLMGTFAVGDVFWYANSSLEPLWADTKSAYDPCPNGWRVPSKSVWADFSKYNRQEGFWDEGNRGVLFPSGTVSDQDIWYPASGSMRFNDASIENYTWPGHGAWYHYGVYSCTEVKSVWYNNEYSGGLCLTGEGIISTNTDGDGKISTSAYKSTGSSVRCQRVE